MRDQRDASTGQRMPKITDEPLETERGKEDSPTGFEGAWACQYLDFRILASRTLKTINYCFKPPSFEYFVTAALGN